MTGNGDIVKLQLVTKQSNYALNPTPESKLVSLRYSGGAGQLNRYMPLTITKK